MRTPRAALRRPLRAAITLVELLVATALASLVMLALLRVVDSSLDLWTKGEVRRALVEQASATAELMATDLRALHGGEQGDLLVDWQGFDVEDDAVVERYWPRIRFVRTAPAADVARHRARLAAEELRLEREPEERDTAVGVEDLLVAQGLVDEETGLAAPPPVDLAATGLMEVCWAVVPEATTGEGRYVGVLLRGEHLRTPGDMPRFLAPDFFGRDGRPEPFALEEISTGVLWCGVQLATQTSILRDADGEPRWEIGPDLEDAATSWDAWNRDRPDPEAHVWNEPGAGMPTVEDLPLLPRRVRLELEIERPRDRERRTRVARTVDAEQSAIRVESGRRLAKEIGAHLMIGGEWMRLERVSGDTLYVDRARRGTTACEHREGELVHRGAPLVVEIPVSLYQDDWALGVGEVR